VRRIQSNFVRPLPISIDEPLSAKVSQRSGSTLERDEAWRKPGTKQLIVEK
jgi:hypothetical protein